MQEPLPEGAKKTRGIDPETATTRHLLTRPPFYSLMPVLQALQRPDSDMNAFTLICAGAQHARIAFFLIKSNTGACGITKDD